MINFDKDLFLMLNFDGGPFMDSAAWFFSAKLVWIPLYLLILYLIYIRYGWKTMLLAIVFIGVGVGIADQISGLFKHFTPKFRPTHDPSLTGLVHMVNGYTGGLYGTVSAHAANTFFIALFTSSLIRNKWFSILIFIWALLVCYSRIYLGAHFPADIMFGVVIGLVTGVVLLKLYHKLVNRIFKNDSSR